MQTAQVPWALSKFLWSLNIFASALVIWRLYTTELYRTYRFFFASLILALARSAALYPFDPQSRIYYHIWIFTEPLLWLFHVLVVSELYSLALKRYRGIYSLGRWFFYVAVSTSAIISALTVLPTMGGPQGNRPPLLYYAALVERGLFTSLAIFLLLLLVLVGWFSIPLSRNLLIHCCVYSAYFFSSNVILLYWHLGINNASLASTLRLSIASACCFCWVFFLSRSGEKSVASLSLGRSQVEERRLLGQLETLNATLLRTARK
jgi:hypothetical protein